MKKLLPNKIFSAVRDISAEKLLLEGKKGVIFDIDDTLVSHKCRTIPQETHDYLEGLKKSGIKIALVSNGSFERVEIISKQLGVFAQAKAKKPKKDALKTCLAHLDLPKEQTVFVGDQIYTDILCANRNQITGYLVRPIDRYENRFFYIKRLLEKPILKKYYKNEKNKMK